MRDVTIIADDLTGAADTGIAFTLAGLPTYVSFGGTSLPPSSRIVALDTDSRAVAASVAAERVLSAARAAYGERTKTIYKKIDSTLRGNVGPEIAAAWRAAAEAFGSALAIVTPAFPSAGRTVRGGRVLVNGVPLDETEVWRKSGMAGSADLTAMLAAAGLAVANALPGPALPRGTQALVCDAESEDDLDRIARAGAQLSIAVVWAGSSGLARHLPAALRLTPGENPALAGRLPEGPVLVLVGSRSSVAREQAQALAAERGVDALVLDPDLLERGEADAGWSRAAEAIERSLASGRDLLLSIELGETIDLQRAPVLAAALGRLAAAQAGRVGGLIATGGDIARAVLRAMGAGGLHLVGEVEPGVPVGVTDTERPLRVVTKAGAFGSKETLRRSRMALKEKRR